MAPHSFWKGYLKLSLVTCPVAMTPATSESERVHFHTLNRNTGHRVHSRYVDAETGSAVNEHDEVKAYQSSDDKFVVLEEEELDSVGLESARTIDIETFMPAKAIGWIWYDKPYYLFPDDPVADEAFSVIREAMAATGMVGLSRLVLFRRERAVMLEPRDRGIVLWTLRYGNEVREPEPYFAHAGTEPPDPALMAMVTKLIEQRTKPWDPSMTGDPVQARLLDIIAAKRKGKRPPKAAQPERPANVVNIMDALRKSLEQSGGKKKKS